MGKLAINELQKKIPSMDDLENAVESTEVSAWYEQQPRKGYSKVASSKRDLNVTEVAITKRSVGESASGVKSQTTPATDATINQKRMNLSRK